jgi:arylsulfatase A-like enzyme
LIPLHEAFKQGGYNTYGAGKLNHHPGGHVDLDGWDEYFARNEKIRAAGFPTGYEGDDLPRPPGGPNSPYYKKLGINKLIGAGFLEWWGVPEEDTDKMMGVQRTKWICDLLKQKHDKPFFMGLGLYTPHFPNYAPQKYFDLYDVDKITLPEIPEDDLDDLPITIQKKQTNRRNQHLVKLQKIGAYKEAVRAYLAAVSYADGLLGDVLDTLEESAYKDNTIVVFWSDQGYHLGEKGDWGKHTLWSETSRVPLFIAGADIPKNKRVESTAGLIDLYPTLMELCQLPKQHKMDGKSLVPELMHTSYQDRDLFIPYHEIGSYSVVNDNYRYIYYAEGTEEFYNTKEDYNEWNNLVGKDKYRATIDKMKQVVPKEFRKPATPKKSLKLIFEEEGYHWESKNGDPPQMTL